MSGSSGDDFRQDRRLSGAVRAGFHRPGAGEGDREQDGPGEHGVHRLEQVGHHAGAEHLQAVFLRARGADAGRGQSGQPLHRHHRSGLEVRAGGAGRRLPPHLPRRSEHRRPLLGAVGFRHGSGGGDGHGRAAIPGSRRCDGDRVFVLPAGGQEPGRAARLDAGRGGEERPRQSDADHFAGHLGFRRMAGTVAGRIHRQGRQGADPGGSRGAGRAGGVRQRSRVRVYSSGKRR